MVSSDQNTQQALILQVIAKYCKQFEEFIDGRFVKDTAV